MNKGLSESQQKAVKRLLPLVLGLDPRHGDEAERIDVAVKRLHDFLRTVPHPSDARQVQDLLLAVNVLCELKHCGKPVHRLSDKALARFYKTLFDGSPTSWVEKLLDKALQFFKKITVHDVARAMRELLCLCYYSQPRTNSHTGYVPLWLRPDLIKVDPDLKNASDFILKPERERFDMRAVEERRRPADPSALDRPFADDGRPKIAIIGSGPAGSVAAARLSEQGWDAGSKTCKYDIAVFEQGPSFEDLAFPLDSLAAMAMLYDRGLLATTKDLDVRLLRARVVGGGSVINIGLSVEIQQATLDCWLEGGIGLSEVALKDALAKIKERQRFRDFNPCTFTTPTIKWGEGLARAGETVMHAVASDLATYDEMHQEGDAPAKGKHCLACGMCNYGCRFGHHLTVDRTFLRDARGRGVRIHANTTVRRLVAERTPALNVKKLELVCGDRSGQIAVDHVVLAAGAVGTPALLLESHHRDRAAGWDDLPGWKHVGEHFGMNYGTPVVARWPERLERPAWHGLQVGGRADQPATGHRWMLENGWVPPGVFAPLAPGIGARHRMWMAAYDRLGMAVNTIGSPSHGRVRRSGDVEYKVTDKEMETIYDTLAYAINGYLHAGAAVVGLSGHRKFEDEHSVFDASFKGEHKKTVERLRRMAPTADRLALTSGHPQGGMRMNAAPEKGAVDSDFRVHGASNLYCADASIFPSTITVNLQWTIMALARLAADALDSHLAQG